MRHLGLSLAIATSLAGYSITDASGATAVSFGLAVQICHNQGGVTMGCNKTTHICACSFCYTVATKPGPTKQCTNVTCDKDGACDVDYTVVGRTVPGARRVPLEPTQRIF